MSLLNRAAPAMLSGVMLVLSCTTVVAAERDNVTIARVGSDRITVAEFREVLRTLRTSGDPGKMAMTIATEGQESILRELIDARLLAQEARVRKIDTDPEVKRRIEMLVTAVLLQSLQEKEVAALNLSDARLQAYYEANQGLFRDSAKVRARHIVVATQEEAAAAQKLLRDGASFAELAGRLNIDNTKDRSGDLGWVPRGFMVKDFETALFALGAGQTSNIVKTRFGFHLIRAEELADEKIQPFSQVKEQIKRKISEQHLNDVRETLRKNAQITIDREQLGRMISE